MTEPKPEYHAEAKWWHVTDQLARDVGELRQAVTLLMQRVEALERRPSQRPASEVTLTGIGETPMTYTWLPEWQRD